MRAGRFRALAVHAALISVTILTLYPVMLVVKKAFEPGRAFALSPSPLPSEVTLENFATLVQQRSGDGQLLFLSSALNSLLVALLTTLVGVAFSCTAAYALSRYRFPGRSSSLASFLIVQMFPSVLLILPLYVLLNRLGLLDSVLGLVLVYATTAVPFCVWNLKSHFDAVPTELADAARIDGASAWATFWRVALPLVKPGIAVTVLFSFMTAWNEFILASTFMTGEASYTLPVLLESYVGQYSSHWGVFAAGAVVTGIPIMTLFYALQRYLVPKAS